MNQQSEGEKVEDSMPECYHYSFDLLLREVQAVFELGINAIACFPLSTNQKSVLPNQEAILE